MSRTRFIGDVHGNKNELKLVLDSILDDVSSIVQVGDMGVGFGQGDYWHESLEDMLQAVNGRFIRGNHDNPHKCKEMRTWIQDGRIENDIMYIGGAWSIDYQQRTKDINWWPEEELSMHQFYGLISVYDYVRPKIMVTHDCPNTISKKLFIDRGKSFSGVQYLTRTGTAFQEMFSIHKPDIWIFGHWHHDADEVIDGTRFICLGELSYVDVDLETLEVRK